MLGKKITNLRKKEGFSQEYLAEKLNVSRQTISKWELGATSPDISYAIEISKLFNISLDELVDNDIRDILESKITNTERLAAMIMRILKIFGIFLIIFTIFFIVWRIVKVSTYAWFIGNNNINCKIGEEHYNYQIDVELIKYESKWYDIFRTVELEESNKIKNIFRIGGNSYLSNIIDIEKYNYTYELFDAVYAYVDKHGGTCNVYE